MPVPKLVKDYVEKNLCKDFPEGRYQEDTLETELEGYSIEGGFEEVPGSNGSVEYLVRKARKSGDGPFLVLWKKTP